MARGVLSLALWALIGLYVVCVVAVKEQPKLVVSSVSVEGLVFCDQCLQDKVTKRSNLLEGAKVAVVCESKLSEAAAIPVEVVAMTDAKGEFRAELPKSAFDSDGEISCAAELRESPQRSCELLGISRRASLAWVRQKAGGAAVMYAAGALSFRPKAASLLCAQASYYMDPFMKPPFKMPPMMKPPFKMPPMMKPPMMKPKFPWLGPMMKPPKPMPMPMPMPMMKPPMMKPKFPWLGPMMKPPLMKPPRPMPMPMPMMKPPMMKPKFPWPRFQFPKKP